MTFPVTMVLRCSVAYMEQSVEMNLTALKAVSKSDGTVCGRSEVSDVPLRDFEPRSHAGNKEGNRDSLLSQQHLATVRRNTTEESPKHRQATRTVTETAILSQQTALERLQTSYTDRQQATFMSDRALVLLHVCVRRCKLIIYRSHFYSQFLLAPVVSHGRSTRSSNSCRKVLDVSRSEELGWLRQTG